MKNGTRPTRIDHRDYDFLKSHKLGGITGGLAALPQEFFCDADLTMPNQEIQDTEFTPPTPSMPMGCTNFAQADISTDLAGKVYNPIALESVTHANALGGLDIRTSLLAARSIGWIKQFFNIRTNGFVDYFDTFRLAQLSGLSEKRSITWGTPWFPSWERSILAGSTIMPMPTDVELNAIRNSWSSPYPWHNSVLDGWTTEAGVLLYRNKSWQGPGIGDKGFIYFPREVINMVMSIKGTVAYTATNNPLTQVSTVDTSIAQMIISLIRNLFP